MPEQILNIGSIKLAWSRWYPWRYLDPDLEYTKISTVPNTPGVYEVIRESSRIRRLTIGQTKNLRQRIAGLCRAGFEFHSSGLRIRATEDVSKLMIRWAQTNRPKAAEEELHRIYRERHGCLPEYTKQT